MGAQCLQVGGKDRVGAEQALDAHRGGDVGEPQQVAEVRDGQHQHSEHAVGAVDQREAFLLPQLDRGDPGRREGLSGRILAAAGIGDHTLSGNRECAVGQRGEVARAAKAAVLVHNRGEARIQQRCIGLHGDLTNAGPAGGQGGQPEQHQRADHFGLDRWSGAGRVAADEAGLELSAQIGRDVPGGKRAEAGGHAVVRLSVGGQRLDDLAAVLHCRHGLGRHQDRRSPPGDSDHFVGRQRASPDGNGRAGGCPAPVGVGVGRSEGGHPYLPALGTGL